MERITRLLYAMAGSLLLIGLAIRIAPAPVGSARDIGARSTPSGSDSSPRVRAPAGADSAIVGGNVFSLSRTAPGVRYSPPDLAPPHQPVRRRPRRADSGLRLLGIVSGTAALIDADPAAQGAEIYQIGDAVRGKRVVAVSESTVVLEGPAGRTVLRLQPAR